MLVKHERSNVLYDCNRRRVKDYVARAMKEHGDIVTTREGFDKNPELVYNFDGNGTVGYANREDFDKLYEILESSIGDERMEVVRGIIGRTMDDIDEKCIKIIHQWSERWPLANS